MPMVNAQDLPSGVTWVRRTASFATGTSALTRTLSSGLRPRRSPSGAESNKSERSSSAVCSCGKSIGMKNASGSPRSVPTMRSPL